MKYLVPIDFTEVTTTAMHHALSLADVTGATIELLHIISSESGRSKAESAFVAHLEQLDASDVSRISTKIVVGDIFTDISKEAEQEGVHLLVMGTHGAKGLQKVFGSRAMKVVTSSATPFIITQKKGPRGKLKRIVMPVDLSKESVQIVKFAADIAKRFDSEVHLVHAKEKDEWLAKKLTINTNQARMELQRRGVESTVHELEGKSSLEKEVIEYGNDIGADMFAVAHFSESILPQFDSFSQHMITNDPQIPTMIISAEAIGNVESQYTFLTM